MIPFNKPTIIGNEIQMLEEVMQNTKFSGDGLFTKKCSKWIQEEFDCFKVLLTTSCTHALEMAAILADIKEGDEVIMPSYTFVSTANAFVLRGAVIKFVDIRQDTLNIDEKLIEDAITERTKVIVPVHYAGVACEMDEIMEIANRYNLIVIEDAAQGVMSSYKGRKLGTIGHLGCYSFHETKNYNCGEGGALLINNPDFVERAEIIWEKGTNRSKFFRGAVDKYSWVDIGSSYLPSELNAAFLYAQLKESDQININRLNSWTLYNNELKSLGEQNYFEVPVIPEYCLHNAHIYHIRLKDVEERQQLINYLREHEIASMFHYIPLHSSVAGLKYGEFVGKDIFTTKESERLLRLPMYYGMREEDILNVCEKIKDFYGLSLVGNVNYSTV
jgi:dTDP-4-amino-4,6-dideoxygalactose transaminase